MNNNELGAVTTSFFEKFPENKKVISIDIETTGTNVKVDKIVQVGAIILERGKTAQSIRILLDPEIPIPKESTEIHGIADADVFGKQKFSDIAENLASIMAGAFIIGYNGVSFDMVILKKEFERSGAAFPDTLGIIDPYIIFTSHEPRTLEAAYAKYVGGEIEGAHDALCDAGTSLKVFLGQTAAYDDMPKTLTELSEAYGKRKEPAIIGSSLPREFVWRNNVAVLAVGKYAERSLEWLVQNEPGYLMWMLKTDFSDRSKEIIKNAMQNRIYPTP